MSAFELDTDEAVIMQTADARTESRGYVDLVLTNKNLIQINKGFGKIKTGVTKYPLTDLKILNGKANILTGKSKSGSKQLELYFTSGEIYYTFSNPFAIGKWTSAITKAHKDRLSELQKSQKTSNGSIFDLLKSTFDKEMPIKDSSSKVCKCNKCGAELSGPKGTEVTCEYCDNVVLIK